MTNKKFIQAISFILIQALLSPVSFGAEHSAPFVVKSSQRSNLSPAIEIGHGQFLHSFWQKYSRLSAHSSSAAASPCPRPRPNHLAYLWQGIKNNILIQHYRRKNLALWLKTNGIYQKRFKYYFLNDFKILKSMVSGDSIVPPQYLQIDIARICGSLCVWCGSGSRAEKIKAADKHFLDKDSLEKLIADFHQEGVTPKIRIASWMGEPLLAKSTLEIIALIHTYGLKAMLVTNGLYMKAPTWRILARCLETINISLDAGSEEVNQKLKPGEPKGSFERKIKNIKGLIKAKKELNSDLEVCVSFMLHPSNYRQIPKLCRRLKTLGVNTFIIKAAHQEENARLGKQQLREAYQLLEQTRSELSDDTFNVYALQTLEEAQAKMTALDKPDFPVCYTAKRETVVARPRAETSFHPCCHYALGTIGTFGSINSDSFGNIWRGRTRQQALGNNPQAFCASCPPTNYHLNKILNRISSAYDADLMMLNFVNAVLDGNQRLVQSLSFLKTFIGRIDPYFGGIIIKALRVLKIYNLRDVLRALSAQQRRLGVIDTSIMLREDNVQSAGPFEIVYNPAKDHSIKQNGTPEFLRIPESILDTIITYNIAALYLIPRFIRLRLIKRLNPAEYARSLTCALPFPSRSYSWRNWAISPDIYPWGEEDIASMISKQHSPQNNITKQDLGDMLDIIPELSGGRITYSTLAAGAKFDHKNFRITGKLPIENELNFPPALIETNAGVEKATITINSSLPNSVLLFAGADKNVVLSEAWRVANALRQENLPFNILISFENNQYKIYILKRAKENSSVFDQPHGAWEVFGRWVLTKEPAFEKINQNKVSPRQATELINTALEEIVAPLKSLPGFNEQPQLITFQSI